MLLGGASQTSYFFAITEMKRGLFVVFEGGDRCGKTTQLQMLAAEFPEAIQIRFPDRDTEIGKLINRYLTSKEETFSAPEEIHRLFVENRKEKAAFIHAKLQEGQLILCDRYSYSGIAYSYAQGVLPLEWCLKVEEEAELPEPDLVLFMDLDPKVAAARKGFGEEALEKIELQEKVYFAFSEVRDRFLSRPNNTLQWFSINADETPEKMAERVLNIVEQKILLKGL